MIQNSRLPTKPNRETSTCVTKKQCMATMIFKDIFLRSLETNGLFLNSATFLEKKTQLSVLRIVLLIQMLTKRIQYDIVSAQIRNAIIKFNKQKSLVSVRSLFHLLIKPFTHQLLLLQVILPTVKSCFSCDKKNLNSYKITY